MSSLSSILLNNSKKKKKNNSNTGTRPSLASRPKPGRQRRRITTLAATASAQQNSSIPAPPEQQSSLTAAAPTSTDTQLPVGRPTLHSPGEKQVSPPSPDDAPQEATEAPDTDTPSAGMQNSSPSHSPPRARHAAPSSVTPPSTSPPKTKSPTQYTALYNYDEENSATDSDTEEDEVAALRIMPNLDPNTDFIENTASLQHHPQEQHKSPQESPTRPIDDEPMEFIEEDLSETGATLEQELAKRNNKTKRRKRKRSQSSSTSERKKKKKSVPSKEKSKDKPSPKKKKSKTTRKKRTKTKTSKKKETKKKSPAKEAESTTQKAAPSTTEHSTDGAVDLQQGTTAEDPMLVDSEEEYEAPPSLRHIIFDEWSGKVMSREAQDKLKQIRARGNEVKASRYDPGNIHGYRQDWRYEVTDSEARRHDGQNDGSEGDNESIADIFGNDDGGDEWDNLVPDGNGDSTGEAGAQLPVDSLQAALDEPDEDDEEDDDIPISTTAHHQAPLKPPAGDSSSANLEALFDEDIGDEPDLFSGGLMLGSHLTDPENYEGYTRTEETFGDRTYVHQNTYARRAPTKRWNSEEIKLLYEALQMFGTDFALISRFFPTRDRREIKNKFSSEEKKDPTTINFLLSNKKEIDLEKFLQASKQKDEHLGLVRRQYVEGRDELHDSDAEDDEWDRVDETGAVAPDGNDPSSESDDEMEPPEARSEVSKQMQPTEDGNSLIDGSTKGTEKDDDDGWGSLAQATTETSAPNPSMEEAFMTALEDDDDIDFEDINF